MNIVHERGIERTWNTISALRPWVAFLRVSRNFMTILDNALFRVPLSPTLFSLLTAFCQTVVDHQPRRNGMTVLISFIGNSDPVRGGYDGPMLHIVRHYRPDVVFLILTQEMQTKSKIALLDESFRFMERHIGLKPVVKHIGLKGTNPAEFKSYGLTTIFTDVFSNYPEADIIAKYVEQFLSTKKTGISMDFLQEHGFLSG